MNRWKVYYMDRRGAGCMRSFSSEADLEKFVRKLRCEARIECDGVEIGEVFRAIGQLDDGRVKWLWSFETETNVNERAAM